MSDFVRGALFGGICVICWALVTAAVVTGIGFGLRRDDEAPDDFDNDVDQALANVADIEAADCRLWELECGWQV